MHGTWYGWQLGAHRFLAFGTEQILRRHDWGRRSGQEACFPFLCSDGTRHSLWSSADSFNSLVFTCVPAGYAWVDIVNFCTKKWRIRKVNQGRAEKLREHQMISFKQSTCFALSLHCPSIANAYKYPRRGVATNDLFWQRRSPDPIFKPPPSICCIIMASFSHVPDIPYIYSASSSTDRLRSHHLSSSAVES